MKHKREPRIFHKAIDGEATKSETRMFKKKLGQDVQTRTEFQKMKRLIKVSGKLQAGVPRGFKGRVLKTLKRSRPRPS